MKIVYIADPFHLHLSKLFSFFNGIFKVIRFGITQNFLQFP